MLIFAISEISEGVVHTKRHHWTTIVEKEIEEREKLCRSDEERELYKLLFINK